MTDPLLLAAVEEELHRFHRPLPPTGSSATAAPRGTTPAAPPAPPRSARPTPPPPVTVEAPPPVPARSAAAAPPLLAAPLPPDAGVPERRPVQPLGLSVRMLLVVTGIGIATAAALSLAALIPR